MSASVISRTVVVRRHAVELVDFGKFGGCQRFALVRYIYPSGANKRKSTTTDAEQRQSRRLIVRKHAGRHEASVASTKTGG